MHDRPLSVGGDERSRSGRGQKPCDREYQDRRGPREGRILRQAFPGQRRGEMARSGGLLPGDEARPGARGDRRRPYRDARRGPVARWLPQYIFHAREKRRALDERAREPRTLHRGAFDRGRRGLLPRDGKAALPRDNDEKRRPHRLGLRARGGETPRLSGAPGDRNGARQALRGHGRAALSQARRVFSR